MYTVVTVSDAEEISSHHNPAEYISAEIKQTEISQVSSTALRNTI